MSFTQSSAGSSFGRHRLGWWVVVVGLVGLIVVGLSAVLGGCSGSSDVGGGEGDSPDGSSEGVVDMPVRPTSTPIFDVELAGFDTPSPRTSTVRSVRVADLASGVVSELGLDLVVEDDWSAVLPDRSGTFHLVRLAASDGLVEVAVIGSHLVDRFALTPIDLAGIFDHDVAAAGQSGPWRLLSIQHGSDLYIARSDDPAVDLEVLVKGLYDRHRAQYAPDGPYDPAARFDPDVVAVPATVQPGDDFEVEFRANTYRSGYYALDRSVDDGWQFEYLVSELEQPGSWTHRDHLDSQYAFADIEFGEEDQTFLTAPPDLEPGSYRLCLIASPPRCARLSIEVPDPE